jgi:hypothetical protein
MKILEKKKERLFEGARRVGVQSLIINNNFGKFPVKPTLLIQLTAEWDSDSPFDGGCGMRKISREQISRIFDLISHHDFE